MGWVIRVALAYALLFQGFAGGFGGSLHAFAATPGSALCEPSRGEAPASDPALHHDLCCILGCAAQQAPATGSDAITLIAPERQDGVVRFTALFATGTTRAPERGFEARGPPGSA